ncbi:MAG: CdaR family protein [Candidatus Promineifilaceae bacterium]
MNRFAGGLLSNLSSLLLALLLALVIWATAVRASDPVETRTLELPIEVVGRPADALLVNRPPDVALLTIQGPASALDDISPGDFAAVIDLSGAPYGEMEVPIQIRASQEPPEQVDALSVFPETALIRLEQIVIREVPVVLEVRGEVARGHTAGEPTVSPPSVQITGPSTRVDPILEGQVAIFLEDAAQDVVEQRRPTFYDAQGNVASVVGLTVTPAEVQVSIPVEELAGFAEKPVTVNWFGEPGPGYRLLNVSVEPSSIQVTGAPAVIEELRVETEPIDISGLTESEIQQAALDLPAGVSTLDVESVAVTFEIEPILSSAVSEETVEVRGLGVGLAAILDPDQIRVFLFGPLPVLDSLEANDVRATVDLLNLELGTHIVEPIVSVNANDVTVRSTQPAEITVIITDALSVTQGITATLESPAEAPASPANQGTPAPEAFAPAGLALAALPAGYFLRRRRGR